MVRQKWSRTALRIRMVCLLAGLLLAVLGTGVTVSAVEPAENVTETVLEQETEAPDAEYTLDKVVILSRHNIRSPMSEKGSLVDELTPHEWFRWTSNPSELSLRGAMLETTMGQYFRLWLEKEGLFPENYIPEEGAV